MKLKRNIITPYLTFLFVIVAFSGVFMFFHIFDAYTKVVHELLGLIFVVFSLLHVIINWKGLKSHFKKQIFIISGIVVLSLSTGFIIIDKMNIRHEEIMIERVVRSPISESFSVLNIDYSEINKKFKENSIVIGESKTIEEIGKNNKKSTKEIIELIIE